MSPSKIDSPLSITTPGDLPKLVLERFEAAKKSESLTFLESEVKVVKINGIPVRPAPPHPLPYPHYLPNILTNVFLLQFQVRYSPTLAKKPKSVSSASSDSKDDNPKINPFQNPPVELTVSGIGANHTLLLNKFCITPGHSILITNKDLPQTYPLEAADIGATYAVIREYHDSGDELFGFFNSGEHSGASQPHRHVQFMPVNQMRVDLEEKDKKAWKPLPAHGERLRDMQNKIPFIYFTAPLKGSETASQLHKTYSALLEVAKQTVASYLSPDPDTEDIDADKDLPETEEVPFSYNMAFMDTLMVILPRISGRSAIENDNEKGKGYLELNGTVLAGTLLVKEKEVYDRFEGDEGSRLLEKVLGGIGVPVGALRGSLDWKRGVAR